MKTGANNFPLSYIQAVEFYKDIEGIDGNVLKAIRNIASQVGAPSYNKTPIFKKPDKDKLYNNGYTTIHKLLNVILKHQNQTRNCINFIHS